MPDIKQAADKFYIGDAQSPKAELTFKPTGDNYITVEHTYVSEELRGQGVAGKLVQKIVAYARENNKQIIPECPYVEKKMRQTAAYHDVLAEQE